MNPDPKALLAAAPMHRLQIMVVGLCVLLNMLDGFDVLAISFAAPGIAASWGIDKARLGVVLSMELFGMAAGSVLIGNIADRFGRRPIILVCLMLMMIGMFGAALANAVVPLSIARLVTGLGIGGMLSSTSAMAAEYSNARRHNLNVALNISGYSMGAILGGMVVSALLGGPDSWRLVFLFGGAMTAIALPCAYLLLPESIDSLLARRPANALAQINQTLVRLGHAPVKSLPPQPDRMEKPSIASLFSRDFAGITILLAIAYFAQIMLFYYIQKWVPKIVADMGFTASQAARVLVCANIGNLLGAVLVGVAAQRLSVRPLIIASMLLGTIAISLFGLGFHDLVRLSVAVAVSAFFINAGVVGLYPIMAATFPASLRATGTGFVIGVGRGGSAIGPIVVGALLARGRRLFRVSVSMGIGGVVAAAMLLLLPLGLARRSDASAR